jgi:hypothetical protein
MKLAFTGDYAMYFIWILLALLCASVLYSIARTLGSSRKTSADHVVALSDSNILLKREMPTQQAARSELQWISLEEVYGLPGNSDDVLVIDMRPSSKKNPLPYPISHPLTISLTQLLDVLPWVPSDCSVILCGAPSFCILMAGAIHRAAGSIPVYLLREDSFEREVA